MVTKKSRVSSSRIVLGPSIGAYIAGGGKGVGVRVGVAVGGTGVFVAFGCGVFDGLLDVGTGVELGGGLPPPDVGLGFGTLVALGTGVFVGGEPTTLHVLLSGTLLQPPLQLAGMHAAFANTLHPTLTVRVDEQ